MSNDAKVQSRSIEVTEYAWDQDSYRPRLKAARGNRWRLDRHAQRWWAIAGLGLLLAIGAVFAITAWPRKSSDTHAAAREAPRLPPHEPIAVPQSRAELIAPRAAVVPLTVPTAASLDTAADAEPLGRLPMTVAVIQGKRMIKVQLVSTSADPLTLTIHAENEVTHKSTSMNLELAPHEQKLFTSEDLDIGQGDLLILHNPQFLDLIAKVL